MPVYIKYQFFFFTQLPFGSYRADRGQPIPRSTHVCNDYNGVIVQCESIPPPHCPASPQCPAPFHPHHDINLYYGRRQTHQWTVTSGISGESQCHETALIRPEKWQVISLQHCLLIWATEPQSQLWPQLANVIISSLLWLWITQWAWQPVGRMNYLFVYYLTKFYRLASTFSTANLSIAVSTHKVHNRSIFIN